MRNTEDKIKYHDTVERYIIEKIWLDPFENSSSNAVGYDVIGFVETPDEAEEVCAEGRDYDVNDCWAIRGKMPEYRYKVVKLIYVSNAIDR